jgi:hypothetical protein
MISGIMPLLVGKIFVWQLNYTTGRGFFIPGREGTMIDPRICKNPVGMIRMKNEDGTWLFSEAECLRRIEVILCRAKKIWLEELVLERKKEQP